MILSIQQNNVDILVQHAQEGYPHEVVNSRR